MDALRPSAAQQTIFALASGAGQAAIAVVRLSGGLCPAIATTLCGALPAPRRASLRRLRWRNELLDQALVLSFPAPDSYTGEHCLELHLHGGRAVVAAVAEVLAALGARPAEPGEFTRRAFLNGRMDLLEAEAVADLIEADSAGQRRQALRQLSGEAGALYRDWAGQLRRALAWQEAQIDFVEEDLPPEIEHEVLGDIAALRAAILSHLGDGRRGERLREGLVVAITGAPNVGKSSLLNALAGEEMAIVSRHPGTTRDPIEARIVLSGIPLTLVDTAGLRDTQDEIEAEGVRRALARAEAADLVLTLCAADAPPSMPPASGLAVANKIDLAPAPAGWLGISAATGAGMETLRAALSRKAERLAGSAGTAPITRARHRVALEDAAAHLAGAAGATYVDQRAEDLRLALRALGRITGEVLVEDLLDTIFSSFCIGK